MRGAGPIGYPGAAEVVNMIPPGRLIKKGIEVSNSMFPKMSFADYQLPCIGDGRQSGTSGSPSILNASPEAATGGMLGYLKDGDVVRIDLLKNTADVKLSTEEIEKRKKEMGPFKFPPSQTPWQEIFRNQVGELSEGAVFNDSVKFQRIAQTMGLPRRNH
jgi:dihydroxy-acid dehydratase